MSLLDRIRPNVEAAPWVCDEIKKLEGIIADLTGERDAYRKAKAENDERFQNEAGEWRERATSAEARLGRQVAMHEGFVEETKVGWAADSARIADLEGLLARIRDSAQLAPATSLREEIDSALSTSTEKV